MLSLFSAGDPTGTGLGGGTGGSTGSSGGGGGGGGGERRILRTRITFTHRSPGRHLAEREHLHIGGWFKNKYYCNGGRLPEIFL